MGTQGNSEGGAGERQTPGHWGDMARVWPQIGPPLRPSPEDIALYSQAIGNWTGSNGAPRVLLLGVTPELHGLGWPEGTDFRAVDRAQSMIESVWPGPRDAAKCANWLDMGLPSASRDIVLADGALNLICYPHDQERLVDAVRNVLAPGGLCILRLFAPPKERETPGSVLSDFKAGKVPSLNVLKLRLWAALQESAEGGVALGDVWRAVSETSDDLEEFAGKIGWTVEHMLAINTYRDSPARYHLLTVDEVEDLFTNGGGFRVSEVLSPSYEYGDRCPMMVFERPRAG